MSKVTNVTYTNISESSSRTAPMYDLNPVSLYSKEYKEGGTIYLNKTAAPDATEKFKLFANRQKSVDSSCEISNPSKRRMAAADKNSSVDEGVSFGVWLDNVYVESDTDDASYRVDYPVRWILSCMLENIGTISDNQLGAQLMRAVSTFKNSDGTWNFTSLRAKFTNINAD